jgi:hypothetical protein
MRLESLNNCADEAVKRFLSIDDFSMCMGNISQNKEYADAYSEFKHKIDLPTEYIDRMYNSQFVRHFYKDDEIAAMRRRWS